MKPLFEGEVWQQGILQIEPPDLSKGEPRIVVSSSIFEFGEWPVSRWWAKTLSLKGGVHFGQPGDFECTLVFQNIDGNKVIQAAPIPIASIEVVLRGPFLTNVLMWITGLIGAGLVGYFINALT